LESTLDKDHAAPFAKLGKKLRRRLGPLRDIDVMLGHLDEIKPSSPHAMAVDWLRARLLRDRHSAREESGRKTQPGDLISRLGTWWALRGDVEKAHSEIPELLTRSLHLQLDAFVENATALINKQAPAELVQRSAAQTDPHALRIAGKNLRYTLELAKAQGHELSKSILATFKRMQKFLGVWHDYVVLGECAMRASLEQDLALHDPMMQRKVLKLIDFALSKAQKQLDGFAKLWTEQGQALTQSIRDAFPLTHPPSESQTGPGPADSPAPPAPAAAPTDSAPAA
jgi:CHAD domain-containing protein